MYNELVNSLRICGKMRSADDYCVAFHDGCCEAEPVCMYELMEQAADAIEELQTTLCNWCAVCPRDKRDLSTCEIYESCRAKSPKEE